MRPLFAIIWPATLLLSGQALSAPEFAPNPRQSFEGFAALNPPRTDVPVGALWIDGYGPSGPAAATDNLETVKSLSSVTIDKNLQLSLSAGLLDLLGIDPKLRDHYVARFADLSIVRVKDIAKLSGVRGEPRIVEALKAGSVTISSDSGFGLNAHTIGFQTSDNVQGSTTNDRSRTYAIEARDMFIAIHVATPELVASAERELKLSRDQRSAEIDDYLILISKEACTPKADCHPAIAVQKRNSYGEEGSDKGAQVGSDFSARLQLPVPMADGQGGLFDSLLVRWIAPCSETAANGCGKEPRLLARFAGTRITDARSVKPANW